jgi:oligoribonuclease (3'-5' exoribonuclease)
VTRLIKRVLRWVRMLTTGADNSTPDVIRIGSILTGAQFLVLAAWNVFVLGNPFDALNYGSGAAALLAATGAALGMKRLSEPQP